MSDLATLKDFDCLAATSLGIVVDIQEKFIPAITDFANDGPAMQAAQQLLNGTTALQIPWIISEQVPDKLGGTVAGITDVLPPTTRRYGKTSFSLFDDADLCSAIADHHRDTLIICGLEAHVCASAALMTPFAAAIASSLPVMLLPHGIQHIDRTRYRACVNSVPYGPC